LHSNAAARTADSFERKKLLALTWINAGRDQRMSNWRVRA
jgi:hypothetical protein